MFEHLKSKIWRKDERIFELKREVQVLRKKLDQIFVLQDANWRLKCKLEEAMVARERSKKGVDYWEDQYDKAVDWAHKLEAERDRLREALIELLHAIASMPPYSVAHLTLDVDKAYFGAVNLLQEVGDGRGAHSGLKEAVL